MTGRHVGILGVDVSWMARIPGCEDIEEIAWPEPKPCKRCRGNASIRLDRYLPATLRRMCPRCNGSGREA